MSSRIVQRSSKCGCMCTVCCVGHKCRTAGPDSQCDTRVRKEVCRRYDESVCGFRFSTEEQSVNCPVKHPSSWPPMFKIRRFEKHAQPPWDGGVAFLYTGEDKDVADSVLGEQLGKLGSVDFDSIQAATYFVDQSQAFAKQEEFVFRGEAFSEMGLTIATKRGHSFPLLVDEGFFSLGLLEPLIESGIGDIEEIMRVFGGGLGFGTDALIQNGSVVCSNAIAKFQKSRAHVTDKLFCSFREAECSDKDRAVDGQKMDAFSVAWDIKDTSKEHFNVEMWVPTKRDPDLKFSRPSIGQNLAANGFLKWITGDDDLSVKLLGIQSVPKPETTFSFDLSSFVGPILFTWVVNLLLPITLVHLVYEKEHNLELMSRMMGLSNFTNILVMYSYYFFMYCLYIGVFLAIGTAIDWKLFTKNSYGVQIMFYFIVGHTQLAVAFLMTAFFQKTSSATGFSYIWIFGHGLISMFLYTRWAKKSNQLLAALMELSPPIAIYRGLYEFSAYAVRAQERDTHGLTWGNLSDDENGMIRVWLISILEWFIFMPLAWLKMQGGMRLLVSKNPMDSIKRILGRRRSKTKFGVNSTELAPALGFNHIPSDMPTSSNTQDEIHTDDEACLPRDNFVVAARDLRKVFPAQDGGEPKVAVSGLNLSVKKGEVVGILGPNGAGKSTAINMMIGLEAPTSGVAYIDGFSILANKRNIYGRMGVCPQENHIWGTLTGREHLTFYGRLKGIPWKGMRTAVDEALASVGLLAEEAGEKRVSKYSGGMKRRLSVAMALIGKPSVVFLDEPSTGMDLYSRRMLWKAVRDSRVHSGILLTTHSMEEAEALCDRIGIFVDGQMICMGSPKELKARYGGYMVLALMVQSGQVAAAKVSIPRLWPSAKLLHSVGGLLKFKIDSTVMLSSVFSTMQNGIDVEVENWSVSHATFEETFIRVVREADSK